MVRVSTPRRPAIGGRNSRHGSHYKSGGGGGGVVQTRDFQQNKSKRVLKEWKLTRIKQEVELEERKDWGYESWEEELEYKQQLLYSCDICGKGEQNRHGCSRDILKIFQASIERSRSDNI